MELVNWLATNKESVSLIIAIVSLLFGVIKYIDMKNRELEFKRFESVTHSLNELSRKDSTVHQQVFFMFELRNYPKYYSVTDRMLRDILSKHTGASNVFINEVQATLAHIQKYNKFGHNRAARWTSAFCHLFCSKKAAK